MALRKANVNLKKDVVTTISGVIALVVPILALVGLITPDQSAGLTTQLGIVGTSITGIIGAISAIVLLFTGTTE